jgi:Flp pilus assembly protein TadD
VKRFALILLMFAIGNAASLQSELAVGRQTYMQGEFKQAKAHLEKAVKQDPEDAAAHYWLGMAYQVLADVATPFGGRYKSKARKQLTRAVELAPDRPEYQRELSHFLVDSSDSSLLGRVLLFGPRVLMSPF